MKITKMVRPVLTLAVAIFALLILNGIRVELHDLNHGSIAVSVNSGYYSRPIEVKVTGSVLTGSVYTQ